MKCPKCGMKYEGSECPNCAVEKALYSSSLQNTGGKDTNFRTEAEYDAYVAKEEERELKKGVDRWMIAFWISIIFGLCAFILNFILSVAGAQDEYLTLLLGRLSSILFVAAVIELLLWYLSDIRRQLILLNKKK